MARKNIAYLYVALAILLFGTTPAVGKLMLTNLNNLQVLFFLSFIATLTLFIIILFQRKISIIKKYNLNDFKTFAYMGFFGIFLYHICLFGALMFAPAQEAFIVNYTWPIWVLFFAVILLKEHFNFKKILAILLSFIGVCIVITQGNFFSLSVLNIKGDLFALAGAIFYGLFSVLGKKQNYEKITSMFFYYGFAFIYILIIILLFYQIPQLGLFEFFGLIWLGVSNSLGFVFWFLALKKGETAKISNLIFLTPFFALVYIYLLVGETILLSSLIGLILIIIGIMIQYIKKKNLCS